VVACPQHEIVQIHAQVIDPCLAVGAILRQAYGLVEILEHLAELVARHEFIRMSPVSEAGFWELPTAGVPYQCRRSFHCVAGGPKAAA